MLHLDAPCETIFTLTFASFNALNALSIISLFLSKFPIKEMIEWPFETATRAVPTSSNSRWTFSNSSCAKSLLQIFAGSNVNETEISDVATTSTEMPLFCNTAKTFARNPY